MSFDRKSLKDMIQTATLDQFYQNLITMTARFPKLAFTNLSEEAGSHKSWLNAAINHNENLYLSSLLRVYTALKEKQEEQLAQNPALKDAVDVSLLIDDAVINFTRMYLDISNDISLEDSIAEHPDIWDGLISRWNEQKGRGKLKAEEIDLLEQVKTCREDVKR